MNLYIQINKYTLIVMKQQLCFATQPYCSVCLSPQL